MGATESTEGEREPLLVPTQTETSIQPVYSRVYGRRWLVLTLFSLCGFMQGMVWNTWGPIQISAKQAFSFSSTDIAVLVLWGPVGFLPWLLFMWLMDKKGEFVLFVNVTIRWQYASIYPTKLTLTQNYGYPFICCVTGVALITSMWKRSWRNKMFSSTWVPRTPNDGETG